MPKGIAPSGAMVVPSGTNLEIRKEVSLAAQG